MRRYTVRAAFTIAVLIILAAWSAGGPPPAQAGPAAPPLRLRVLNINIFDGGDELNLQTGGWCSRPDGCPGTLAKVIETIRAAGLRDSYRAVHPDPVAVPGFRWDWLGIHAPGAVDENPNATTCEASYRSPPRRRSRW